MYRCKKCGGTFEFQSTLPHGSDCRVCRFAFQRPRYFNPRSLTGATRKDSRRLLAGEISIHAPSRERRMVLTLLVQSRLFQSTLPHGSDAEDIFKLGFVTIFQSTLPHGSDEWFLS